MNLPTPTEFDLKYAVELAEKMKVKVSKLDHVSLLESDAEELAEMVVALVKRVEDLNQFAMKTELLLGKSLVRIERLKTQRDNAVTMKRAWLIAHPFLKSAYDKLLQTVKHYAKYENYGVSAYEIGGMQTPYSDFLPSDLDYDKPIEDRVYAGKAARQALKELGYEV